MTEEVADHRARLEHSAEELQQINAALEERRRLHETILQSLSASSRLDERSNVTMINEAAMQCCKSVGEAPITGAGAGGFAARVNSARSCSRAPPGCDRFLQEFISRSPIRLAWTHRSPSSLPCPARQARCAAPSSSSRI